MKPNKEIVIERLSADEYYKCGNIWDMEKFPYTEQFYQQIKSGNRIVFIYKINGEFIGEGSLVLENGDYTIPNERIYLSRLLVKKEYRNHGIGKKIAEFLIDKAKEWGYSEITLGVDCDNKAAVHLYKKIGFEVYSCEEDEYGEFYKMLKKLY